MCVINGQRVTREEFIEFMQLRRELRNSLVSAHNRELPQAQYGYTYLDWPVIKPLQGGKDFEVKMVHWEYIPSFVYDEFQLKEFRKQYMWLNAKAENLLTNEKGKASIYREGALYGRCLVLSSGFYEHRHITKMGKKGQPLKSTDKIPYFITLQNNPPYFFMAGVSRVWTNQRVNKSADTFAIVTTEANELMRKVHNSKMRMPTILPPDLAQEWIQDGLSEQRILEIAAYQYPADQMIAWPVTSKPFECETPEQEIHYENLPPL